MLQESLNIDLIYFNFFSSENPKVFIPKFPSFPKNIIIKQPKLRSAFFKKR